MLDAVLRFLKRNQRVPCWEVRHHGVPVALLEDPRFEDMFWASWNVRPLSDAPEVLLALNDPEFWTREALTFHDPDTGDCPAYALPAGNPIVGGRVVFRGL